MLSLKLKIVQLLRLVETSAVLSSVYLIFPKVNGPFVVSR